jgi:hypothetical protein
MQRMKVDFRATWWRTSQTTEYTEWQWLLSGVTLHHDGKISPSWVRVGLHGARPPPFTLSTITSKVVVYSPAERADISHLPLYVLWESNCTHTHEKIHFLGTDFVGGWVGLCVEAVSLRFNVG